jgi:aminopeptidase N
MLSIQRKFFELFLLGMMYLLSAVPAGATGKVIGKEQTRPALPKLVVSDIQTKNHRGQIVFSFRISQQAQTPLTLQVPILITTGIGVFHFERTISSLNTDLSFALPDPPLKLIIDQDQSLKRQLTASEIPPLWSGILQAKEITVVPDTPSLSIYAPLVHALPNKIKILSADKIKDSMLGKTTLLFLGAGNRAGRSLFAKPKFSGAGFSLDIHRNPLAPEYLAAFAVGSSEEEIKAALGQLDKDGDFSSIRFKHGKIIKKSRRKSESGQIYTLERLPAGAPTSAIDSFSRIIDNAAASRVVYVGETHNSAADHSLEFRIIQALYKRDAHLAIGMEMFPGSSQKALDEYVLENTDMSERDFLKKSNYFHVWRYDFRLFRDIFNFARRYRIPIIALNLESHIVSSIFKTGSTDSLSREERLELPMDRNLDMPGYADRLRTIYGIHTQEMKEHGTASGFLQAQAVWDETMAKNIADYLMGHPAVHMVVLAGVQHIRKDSGIPPRVNRYMPIKQCSIVNISSQDQYTDIVDIADYFFMEQASSLPPPAKIGIILEQVKSGDTSQLKIDGFNPHGNAEEAGLQKNDILLSINGNPVYDMDDVRIAMVDVEAGEPVMVKIRRMDASDQKREILYKVTTRPLALSRIHP